jgi:hypothetical protein
MKPFMADRRKMIELLPLPILLAFIIVFYPRPLVSILFAFGYIWNWTVSQSLLYVQESTRYKFSTLKLIKNIHQLCLKPIQKINNKWVHKIVSLLPAGLFWGLIAHSLGSDILFLTEFVQTMDHLLYENSSCFYCSILQRCNIFRI